MPERARCCHFSDYTASLNIKWCMKMLYLDNRLYLNVKCVLGAHFHSAVLFLCKKSFCKIAQTSISASGPSLLEQFFLHIKHYLWKRCGIPSLLSTCLNTLTLEFRSWFGFKLFYILLNSFPEHYLLESVGKKPWNTHASIWTGNLGR